MNKENPKKNKKSFEYYIAQRKEEFRCQYDHERSWENLQYKLQKRKNHRLSLYCVAASAAFLFLILGVSHIFSLHNNTQNKEAVVAAVVSFPRLVHVFHLGLDIDVVGAGGGFISGNRQPQGYPYFREWRKSGSVC